MGKLGQLPAPLKPITLPEDCQWLGGQGAGAWFRLSRDGFDAAIFRLQRYSPSGIEECNRVFVQLTEADFNIDEAYEFTYPSHCAECSIIQNEQLFKFRFIELN